MRGTPLLITWLMVVPVTARAATWVVDPDGGGDFETISEAVEAAAPGDEIEVLPGTYAESVDLGDKPLLLFAAEGPEVTEIAGGPYGFRLAGNGGSAIDGFAITDCEHAVQVEQQSTVTLTSMMLRANWTGDEGAGLRVTDESVAAVGWSVFEENDAEGLGGAVYLSGGSTVGLYECELWGNWSAHGGAVAAVDASMLGVSYSWLQANFAEVAGGGIFLSQSSAWIAGGVLIDNAAIGDEGGGGAIAASGSTVYLASAELVGNDGPVGGGMMLAESLASVNHCVLEGNLAAEMGGALAAESTEVWVVDSWVVGNEVSGLEGFGAGVALVDSESGLYNSWVCGNSAHGAAGVALSGGTATLANSRIVGNRAEGGVAGAAVAGVDLTLYNMDFVGNIGVIDHLYLGGEDAATTGFVVNTHFVGGDSAALCMESSDEVSFDYNDVWGTPADFDCDHEGLSPSLVGLGNMIHDPLFEAYEEDDDCWGHDLHLQSGSPSIDAGYPLPEYGDPDGSPADVGSYGGPNAPEDLDEDGSSVAGGDCDDGNPDTYPGAPELCDGLDNDCDEQLSSWETDDLDGDGAVSCEDCDDTNEDASPDLDEDCEDPVDNDCDGLGDADDSDCAEGDDDDTDGDDDDTVDDDDTSEGGVTDIGDDARISGTCVCRQAVIPSGSAAPLPCLLTVLLLRRRSLLLLPPAAGTVVTERISRSAR